MKAILTISLLICSNTFMTFAWYGNLILRQRHISDSWPLPLVILLSWCVAALEYCFMVPANTIGSDINGGPFSIVQLKVIQEVVSLTVFVGIVTACMQGQQFHWNHLVSFILIVAAVFFAFIKT